MLTACEQAAGAVPLGGAGAAAAIIGEQHTRASGEHLVHVFFDGPRRAHPPAGHLPDHRVHPQELIYLLRQVVPLINDGFTRVVPLSLQGTAGGLMQGVVQAARRVAEYFTAVQK